MQGKDHGKTFGRLALVVLHTVLLLKAYNCGDRLENQQNFPKLTKLPHQPFINYD